MEETSRLLIDWEVGPLQRPATGVGVTIWHGEENTTDRRKGTALRLALTPREATELAGALERAVLRAAQQYAAGKTMN